MVSQTICFLLALLSVIILMALAMIWMSRSTKHVLPTSTQAYQSSDLTTNCASACYCSGGVCFCVDNNRLTL